jgi:hypothetical protein
MAYCPSQYKTDAMKSKTNLSIAAVNAIEKLIAAALKGRTIGKAYELAESIGRSLTKDELNSYISRELKRKDVSLYNLRNLVEDYKAPKAILVEILAKAVSTGTFFVAYDIAVMLNRNLTQVEVDTLHRKVLRSKQTPEQKGKDWHNILYCNITGNRPRTNLRMELTPSPKLADQIITFCLEHNEMKAGHDLLWLSRGRSDAAKITTVDDFVTRTFEQYKAKGGTTSFIPDTPSREIFSMASPAVVQKILKVLLKTESRPYQMLEYAKCDSSGESYAAIIEKFCKNASTIDDSIDKNKYLRETSALIAQDMKNIELPIKALKKWFAINVAAKQGYNNFTIAYNLQLPHEMRDGVFEILRKQNLYYRCRDLYIKRGGSDAIRDWVIACISIPNSLGGGDNFRPDEVFQMGGTDAIEKLMQNLLANTENTYCAITVAEKHYVSHHTREKVITRALEQGYHLHTLEKLTAINRRKLTPAEIDMLFKHAVNEFEEKDYNITSNAQEAMKVLKLKPTKGLEKPFIKTLQKRKMLPQIIEVLRLTGRESEIDSFVK